MKEKYINNSTNNGNRYKNKASVKKKVIVDNEFKCLYNDEHITFSSKSGMPNYIEGHHLVPMGAQDDVEFWLDIKENIASLCPNCHKQIHYGTECERKLIFDKLVELMGHSFENVDFEEVFIKYYK